MLPRTVRNTAVMFAFVLVEPIYASPPAGALAKVESVAFRTTGRDFLLADVELRNMTKQTITAFSVTVKAAYSTGRVLSRSVTSDSVFALAFERLGLIAPPNTRFDSNTVSTESVAFPTDPNGVLPTATATVEMVALADRTIYGSPEAAELLQQRRKAESYDNGEVADTLAQLQGVRDTGSELTRIIAARRAVMPSDEGRRRQEEARVAKLEKAIRPLITTASELNTVMRLYRERQLVLFEHSSLNQSEMEGESKK